MIEKFFKLTENNTNIKTEVIAGFTTFFTMVYILAVNPVILSQAGMDKGAVFTATAIAAVISTLFIAFVAKLPIGFAPAMGLNTYFAYSIVGAMGYTWQFALTAVFISGIILIIMIACKIDKYIVDAIPRTLKYAITTGIGLFITFVGLYNSGIIKTGLSIDSAGNLSGAPLMLNNLTQPGVIVAIVGVIIAGVLLIKNVKSALLLSIIAAALVGIPLGVTKFSTGFSLVSLPPSVAPVFIKFSMANVFSLDMVIVVFSLIFMTIFGTLGALIGVTTEAGLINKETGKIPNSNRAFMGAAIGTTCSAVLGSCSVTAYVESASGASAGGRTGLTSAVVGILFICSLFFAPLYLGVPAEATAPVLIIIGLFMTSSIKEIINEEDFSEVIPSFFTVIFMPFAYSIADGIVLGVLSYVIFKLFSGKLKDINIVLIVLSILFLVKLII